MSVKCVNGVFYDKFKLEVQKKYKEKVWENNQVHEQRIVGEEWLRFSTSKSLHTHRPCGNNLGCMLPSLIDLIFDRAERS